MVEAAECGLCGQGLPKQLTSQAGVITCPRCGGSVNLAASGNAGANVSVRKKSSSTAKALAEALRAMEEKENGRKGKDKGRPVHQERAAYELNAKRSSAAPVAASAATSATKAPDAIGKPAVVSMSTPRRLKPGQW